MFSPINLKGWYAAENDKDMGQSLSSPTTNVVLLDNKKSNVFVYIHVPFHKAVSW